VKRKLDGFQIYTGDSWATWNQTVANIVGIVALFLILIWVKNTSTSSPGYPTIVLLSLFGGILSPIAKDLVTALKRVKDG
jgi:NADH:ubiquinone oxidoreductase subunit 2 (subunit N)